MAAESPSVTSRPLMDFVNRYHGLRTHHDTEGQLIEDIVLYCQSVETNLQIENADLKQALKNLQLDFEDATRSRRDMQQQLGQIQKHTINLEAECDSMKTRNPYIVVLIDGDGLIFTDDYLRQGLDGGKRAANALRNAILQHRSFDLSESTEIIVKICANLSGLSQALKRDGAIDNPLDLRQFSLGFNQAKASFDYLDVGRGKERADSKLKECMRWHLRNYNCKHIVLGISHDAGYAPFLDEVMTADDRNKISILEGPPTVYELKTLGLPIISYTDIFRTEKPVDRVQPVESASQAPPSGVNITASKTSTAASSPATTWAGITTAASTLSISPAGTEVPPVISIKNARGAVRPPEWVPEPRGLDPFVTPNLHSLADIKRKTGSEKLCNNYFLRGACSKGNECPYKHRPKLGEDDLNALAYLSRLNPCQQGQYCPDYTCVYGHHCPAYKLEKKSNGEMAYYCRWYCKFDEEGHPPGTIMSYAQ